MGRFLLTLKMVTFIETYFCPSIQNIANFMSLYLKNFKLLNDIIFIITNKDFLNATNSMLSCHSNKLYNILHKLKFNF